MNKKILNFIFIIGLAFFMLTTICVASESLKDFDGKPQKLNDYTGKGKWLVVMMWAHDCHACNAEAHQYVTFHEKHKNLDAQVLGISLDGSGKEKQAKAFLDRHKINFNSLIGEANVVANMYEDLTGADWFGTPTFLIYNPKGELKAQQVGAVPTDLIEAFIKKESQVVAN